MKAPYKSKFSFTEGRVSAPRRVWLSPQGNGYYEETRPRQEASNGHVESTRTEEQELLIRHAPATVGVGATIRKMNIAPEAMVLIERPRFVAVKKP